MMTAKPAPLPGEPPAPEAGKPYTTRYQISPFGDRFRVAFTNGVNNVDMLMTPAQLRQLRDDATKALGEGRATRKGKLR